MKYTPTLILCTHVSFKYLENLTVMLMKYEFLSNTVHVHVKASHCIEQHKHL